MIPVLKPKGGLFEAYALYKTLKSGWWGKGPRVDELEEKFAKFVGKKYAVAVDSCTSALDLAIKAHGIKGGEMITTPLTFISTALAGLYNGMKVKFGDIDPRTLCLDPNSIKPNKKTKVIIVVHNNGTVADIRGIRDKFNGLIVEDCAHAGGMTINDGIGQGDIQCWSFQAVKTLPAGDGGMITTDDEEIYKKLKPLIWCGIDKSTFERTKKTYSWDYNINQIGYKRYMNDITATIALCQLRKIVKMNRRRREIRDMYSRFLDACSPTNNSVSGQHYIVYVDNRDRVADVLAQNGISTGVHYKPLTEHPLFKQKTPKMTSSIWGKILTLPCYYGLSNKQIKKIIRAFNEAICSKK